MTTPVFLHWLRQAGVRRTRTPLILMSSRATLLEAPAFVQMLRFECRRLERSGKQLILVLIHSDDLRNRRFAHQVGVALAACTRETDVLGWYQRDRTVGVLMTETRDTRTATIQIIMCKIIRCLANSLTPEEFKRLDVNYRLFPHQESVSAGPAKGRAAYPETATRPRDMPAVFVKRLVDIVGSVAALILLLPVFAILILIVKFTSEGPVLFCQQRVGRQGRPFTFLKFRTMYVNNDPEIHKEFVTKFIAGDHSVEAGSGLYKMTRDPRVTPVGRFLRRSSLDELPQFINVLLGQMSLVGPRPPLPYEYERYRLWHKRRVMDLKPGLTGPWQVGGRSSTTFDEMVRLDLRYANTKSVWTDIRILLKTPRAVFSGHGAC